MGRSHEPQTMRQASRRLTDLVVAWRDANPEQRARLAPIPLEWFPNRSAAIASWVQISKKES
jgi:hypothetical protein